MGPVDACAGVVTFSERDGAAFSGVLCARAPARASARGRPGAAQAVAARPGSRRCAGAAGAGAATGGRGASDAFGAAAGAAAGGGARAAWRRAAVALKLPAASPLERPALHSASPAASLPSAHSGCAAGSVPALPAAAPLQRAARQRARPSGCIWPGARGACGGVVTDGNGARTGSTPVWRCQAPARFAR